MIELDVKMSGGWCGCLSMLRRPKESENSDVRENTNEF